MKRYLIITLLFILSGELAFSKVLSSGIHANDRTAARYILGILRDSRLSTSDRNSLNKLLKLTEKPNSLFHQYHSGFQNIKMSYGKTKKKFTQSCFSFKSKGSNDIVQKRIERLYLSLCHKKVLDGIEGFAKNINNVNGDLIVDSLIAGTQKWSLRRIRTKLNKIKKSNPSFLEFLRINIIERNIVPTSRFFNQVLAKDLEFKAYLADSDQNKGIRNKSFISKIRKSRKRIKKELDNKKFLKAQSIANDAISFFMVNAKDVDKTLIWPQFHAMAKSFAYHEHFNEAREIFKFNSLIGNKEQHEDSIFSIIWSYLVNEQYKEAFKFAQEERIDSNKYVGYSKLQFWMAHLYKHFGNTERAKQIYKNIILSSPLNYYSILSKNELANLDSSEGKKILATMSLPKGSEFMNIDFTKDGDTKFNLYKVFKSLKADLYAFNQLEQIPSGDKFFKNNPNNSAANRYYSLISKLNSNHDYLSSFKIYYRALNRDILPVNQRLLAMLFPTRYDQFIEKLADNIDSDVFLSLIRQESAFNPKAKSRVGARGLMQIMPQTARQYYKRLPASKLESPSLNIKIGVKYFKKLIKKYSGNLIYALAAYNAGEGRVKRWKKSVFKSEDPLLLVESIPFTETQNYVKLIYRNLFFYKMLSKEKSPFKKIDESFKIDSYGI